MIKELKVKHSCLTKEITAAIYDEIFKLFIFIYEK